MFPIIQVSIQKSKGTLESLEKTFNGNKSNLVIMIEVK